tara:strand:- start:1767 stop:2159 length:393 start_codon:yes stop_codon:yes gene_type:complete
MAVKTEAQKNAWFIKDDKIGIVKTTTTSDVSVTSPSTVDTVRLHFIKRDEDFIAANTGIGIGMDESPAIPAEFHETLTHYAVARGYEKRPDMINSAIYFRNLWQQELNKAKKESDINKDGTPYFIKGYDF